MATESDIKKVETIIGYDFGDKRLIKQALTAAGAEKENHDGNRKLAQIGTALIEFLSVYVGFEASASRDLTHSFKAYMSSVDHRADVVRQLGIDHCIKYSPKDGGSRPSVQGKALNAIVGAAFADSGDLTPISKLMLKTGMFQRGNSPVTPQVLSLDGIAGCPSFKSAIDLLLNGGFQIIPSSENAMTWYSNSPQLPRNTPEALQATLGAVDDVSELQCVRDQNVASPFASSGNTTVDDGEYLSSFSDQPSRGISSTPSRLVGSTEPPVEPPQDVLSVQSPNRSRRVSEDATSRRPFGHEVPASNLPRKRRGDSCEGARSKFAKLGPERALPGRASILKEYLAREEEKCRSNGFPGPEAAFFGKHIKDQLRALEKRRTDHLSIILFGIANSESIATLQDMIRRCRDGNGDGRCKPDHPISLVQRFNMIQRLDSQVAYFSLLKRYHTLRIFEDSGGASTRATTGMVLSRVEDFTHSMNGPGNPANKAEAAVTKAIINNIFPSSGRGAPEYPKKYKIAKKLRKLGQRLHALTSRFGEGILGLIPHQSLTGEFEIGISDEMILAPSDSTFRSFISVLEQSQGPMLREISTAICPIVHALVQENFREIEPFAIESVDEREILELPKGSGRLLRLMEKSPSSTVSTMGEASTS